MAMSLNSRSHTSTKSLGEQDSPRKDSFANFGQQNWQHSFGFDLKTTGLLIRGSGVMYA
jgi:hypothetical protein